MTSPYSRSDSSPHDPGGRRAGGYRPSWACLAAAGVMLCLLTKADAQMTVAIRFQHKSYLQFEAITATVTVHNQTTDLLVVGGVGDSAVLGIEIEKDGEPVPMVSSDPIARSILVLPGKDKEATVELRNHFSLQQVGRYRVTASVVKGEMRFVSAPVNVEIVQGLEIMSVERCLPDASDQVRRYSLRCWERNGKEQVFLRVTDDKQSESYGVFPLGPILRMMKPEITADLDGRVRVRHQSRGDAITYSYFVSGRAGVVFLRQENRLLVEGKEVKTE